MTRTICDHFPRLQVLRIEYDRGQCLIWNQDRTLPLDITAQQLAPFAKLRHLVELHLSFVRIPESVVEGEEEPFLHIRRPTNIRKLVLLKIRPQEFSPAIVRAQLHALLPKLEELSVNGVAIPLRD